jgi:oligopeptide/dipeptide ABC transporter ATP-binding protein
VSALLELRGVSVEFRDGRRAVVACRDVGLEVGPGEVVGLVGESGSGKSTVANVALGLLTPTSGVARFRGEPLGARSRGELKTVRADIQAVFQEPLLALDSRRTIGWTIEEPLRIHGRGDRLERRSRVNELLDAVGLERGIVSRHPAELSGGQLQRVNIARAIALRPSLLVCDEPVSALDVSVQAQIINLFLEIQATLGIGMLFISHDLAVVRHLSDRIVVMYAGRVVEEGPTDEVCQAPHHPYTHALLEASLEPEPSRPSAGAAPAFREAVPTDGCPFSPRCPYSEAGCETGSLPLFATAPGRTSACRRVGELAMITGDRDEGMVGT